MDQPIRLENEPEYFTNSFKYGLPSTAFVIDGEDPLFVSESLSRMFDAYEPKGTDELFLVERILYSNILCQRAFNDFQSYFFAAKRGAVDFNRPLQKNQMEMVIAVTRYMVQHERSAERANDMFYRNRASRRKEVTADQLSQQAENQAVPQSAAPPETKAQNSSVTPTKQSSTGFVPKNKKSPVSQPHNPVKPAPKIPPIA